MLRDYYFILVDQVCGNSEHVKFLNEWLKGWDERGHRNKQNIVTNGSMNGRSCQDGSDTDYSEDASDYENVLLITGPVGVSFILKITCRLHCMLHVLFCFFF